MTDYKGAKGSSTPSWKKQESSRKWQRIVAILFCVVLFFAAINGVLRSVFALASFSKPKWDGESTFSISLDTNPVSVFVFQKDPKRIALFSVPFDRNHGDGKVLQDEVSNILGVKIENYVDLSDEQNLDSDTQKEIVESLTSLSTPFKVLALGWGDKVSNTNITRIDAIRIWWQVKGIGVKDLNFADLSSFTNKASKSEEKVLGADTDLISRQIFLYFINQKVIEEDADVEIHDGTSEGEAGAAAARFVENVGGKVTTVVSVPTVSGCTVVADDKSYTSKYLANLFDCDIKGAQSERKSSKITLILGEDFSKN